MNRILVVDDDYEIASAVKMILELHDFKCQIITNYKCFQNKIDEFSPDLIILDIFLNGADGRQVCKEFMQKNPQAKVKIILFSANQDASRSYKNYHADAFISKPFDTDNLISIIRQLIEAAA